MNQDLKVGLVVATTIVLLAAMLAIGATWSTIDEEHQQTVRTCINQHLSAEQCQAFGRLP